MAFLVKEIVWLVPNKKFWLKQKFRVGKLLLFMTNLKIKLCNRNVAIPSPTSTTFTILTSTHFLKAYTPSAQPVDSPCSQWQFITCKHLWNEKESQAGSCPGKMSQHPNSSSECTIQCHLSVVLYSTSNLQFPSLHKLHKKLKRLAILTKITARCDYHSQNRNFVYFFRSFFSLSSSFIPYCTENYRHNYANCANEQVACAEELILASKHVSCSHDEALYAIETPYIIIIGDLYLVEALF